MRDSRRLDKAGNGATALRAVKFNDCVARQVMKSRVTDKDPVGASIGIPSQQESRETRNRTTGGAMVSEYGNIGTINELDASITRRCRLADNVIRNSEISDLLREDDMKPNRSGPVHIKRNRVRVDCARRRGNV